MLASVFKIALDMDIDGGRRIVAGATEGGIFGCARREGDGNEEESGEDLHHGVDYYYVRE